MDIIHIIVIIAGLFALSRVVLRWRESKMSLGELMFWCAIWLGAMLFALFPGILGWLSNRAGFRRGMDFLIAISIMVLFYLVFRIYIKIEDMRKETTKIVRELAFLKKKV